MSKGDLLKSAGLKPHEWGYFPTRMLKTYKKVGKGLKPHEWGYFPTWVQERPLWVISVSNLMNEDIFQHDRLEAMGVYDKVSNLMNEDIFQQGADE